MASCRICRTKQCGALTGAAGIFLMLAGIALIGGFIAITKNSVIQDVRLVPGTLAYDGFEEMAVPMRMQYWVWNMVNPDEFMEGAKPIMEQIGPYTYFEHREKLDISHDHDNSTVTYQGRKKYIFVPEESVGLESDTFITVNVPVFTVANLLKDLPGPVQNIQTLIHALSNATSILELSVYDILWGYEDDYLLLFDELFPGQIESTLFGIFVGTNNTLGSVWVLDTGEKNVKRVGEVLAQDGITELDYWNTEWANMINGTDGSVTSPFRHEGDKAEFYVSVICRSGYATYTNEATLEGISVGHYEIPPELFANVSINPDNEGFCYPDLDNCAPSGLLNAESCQSGAPIYFSLPHFLFGDPSVLDGVIGMNPVREEHVLVLEVEMLTGIVFGVNNRIQVNLKVQPYDYVPDTVNMPALTYVPIIWLNESSVIDSESAEFFKSGILLPLLIARIMIGVLLGIGVVMVIGAIIGYCYVCRHNDKDKDQFSENIPVMKSEAFAESETKFDYGAIL